MQKSFFILLLLLLCSACSKIRENFLWYRSFGKGEAFFVSSAGDTGIVGGGVLSNRPYLVFLNENHEKSFEFCPDTAGIFTSAVTCEDGVITAGCIGGKLYLALVDFKGTPLWDSVYGSSFTIGKVTLCRDGQENFLAVASRASDSVPEGNYGVRFISFSKDGLVKASDSILFYSFYTVNASAIDNSGNIYLAVTRLGPGNRKKATVARFGPDYKKIWEMDLYNNPQFEASSLSVTTDDQGNIYISGYTEYPEGPTLYRSAFVASVSSSGAIRWKKYLEYNNEATSVFLDKNAQLYVLNKGCLIVSLINPADGTTKGILRTFAACDVSSDRVSGNGATAGYGSSVVIAGTKDGSFYIVARSPEILSPV